MCKFSCIIDSVAWLKCDINNISSTLIIHINASVVIIPEHVKTDILCSEYRAVVVSKHHIV